LFLADVKSIIVPVGELRANRWKSVCMSILLGRAYIIAEPTMLRALVSLGYKAVVAQSINTNI
jgi:hypothetical protein